MRAIHLLGLKGEGGAPLRFRLEDSGALVIPWWVPEGDREVLLAFFQQVISDAPLPRVEVDWGRSLLPADRTFLRGERMRHGAEDRLVVMRVRGDDVDLLDVQAQPEVQAFRHVAIVCSAPTRNETVRALQQLGRAAVLAVEARYEQLAGELDLRADGHAMLGAIHRRLLNPIAAVECFNTLVDLHAEGVPAERHEESVVARVLGRELDHLSEERSSMPSSRSSARWR